MTGRVEIFKRGVINKEHRFRLVSRNNEIIAQSEGYKSKQAMMDTIMAYFPEWPMVEGHARRA